MRRDRRPSGFVKTRMRTFLAFVTSHTIVRESTSVLLFLLAVSREVEKRARIEAEKREL